MTFFMRPLAVCAMSAWQEYSDEVLRLSETLHVYSYQKAPLEGSKDKATALRKPDAEFSPSCVPSMLDPQSALTSCLQLRDILNALREGLQVCALAFPSIQSQIGDHGLVLHNT